MGIAQEHLTRLARLHREAEKEDAERDAAKACDARVKELLVGMEQRIANAYTLGFKDSVAIERERCAKIVEGYEPRTDPAWIALTVIAAAIREGKR